VDGLWSEVPTNGTLSITSDGGSLDRVLHDIMAHLDVGIVVFNVPERQLAFLNKTALQLLADSISKPSYSILFDLLLGGQPLSEAIPRQMQVRSGNRLLGYTIYRIAENYLCLLINDITEKSRLMSIAEAVNTMDNIGYVFSGIRHEIGNPINSIKMTMSVLKHNLAEFSAEMVEEYVDRTLSEIGRVEYLLQSLRNFSMFENVELKPLELIGFLETIMSMAEKDMELRGIALQSELQQSKFSVLADARALQQVLLNLLANAASALEGREDPVITIRLNRESDLIRLSVCDNGPGMSESELKQLFKPFYTTKAEGTGLGLVICRKMLAQMNCSIEVQSTPGQGTSVDISLNPRDGHAQ